MKERILLVDDNEAFLDSTKDILEDQGYEVVTAESGEEAVRVFGAHTFDVILMDIKMPSFFDINQISYNIFVQQRA